MVNTTRQKELTREQRGYRKSIILVPTLAKKWSNQGKHEAEVQNTAQIRTDASKRRKWGKG